MAPEDDILTINELHVYLKIPKPTLYSMVQAGRLPAVKLGKHWRFLRSDIQEWLKSQHWTPRPVRHRSPKQEATNAG